MPFHSFLSDSGVEYGRFETWFHEPSNFYPDGADLSDIWQERGWYWWRPEEEVAGSDPHGPFETETAAIADAQEHAP